MSKRRLGFKLYEAVVTTMVAISNDQKRDGVQAQVGDAIDRVFDKVLGSTFADYQVLEIDDFI